MVIFLPFQITRFTGFDEEPFSGHYQQEKAQYFLHVVLNRYEQTGSTELSGLGTVQDVFTAFGGRPVQLLAAFKQLQQQFITNLRAHYAGH